MKLSRATIVMLGALVISVALNAFLFRQSVQWREAFFRQAGTTGEVELLFKEFEADTSYENVLTLSQRLFGESVEEVKAGQTHIKFGTDEKAIKMSNTKLLFKEGKYYGSETHLPNH